MFSPNIKKKKKSQFQVPAPCWLSGEEEGVLLPSDKVMVIDELCPGTFILYDDGLYIISRVTYIPCYWIHLTIRMLWDTVNGCTVSNHSYYVFNVKLSRKEVEETDMRKYIGFATPNKAKTSVHGCLISFRLWLRACVRLWPHHGARMTPCG